MKYKALKRIGKTRLRKCQGLTKALTNGNKDMEVVAVKLKGNV